MDVFISEFRPGPGKPGKVFGHPQWNTHITQVTCEFKRFQNVAFQFVFCSSAHLIEGPWNTLNFKWPFWEISRIIRTSHANLSIKIFKNTWNCALLDSLLDSTLDRQSTKWYFQMTSSPQSDCQILINAHYLKVHATTISIQPSSFLPFLFSPKAKKVKWNFSRLCIYL